MSQKVVLDRETWLNALTDDTDGFLHTLIDICDQIVLNDSIRQEYGYNSALLPMMESLAQRKPKPKIIELRSGPKPQILIRSRQHGHLIRGAIRATADILVMSTQIRGKWETLAKELEKYHISIITPEEYITDRNQKRNS